MTTSKNPGSSFLSISLRAPANRFSILSSVSVARPRSRASRASNEGGAMKMYLASSPDRLTCSAPCTSMSRMQTAPVAVTASTDDLGVP
eukprot:scaffold13317_cov33-Tisochrysis_lutea.AAC.1